MPRDDDFGAGPGARDEHQPTFTVAPAGLRIRRTCVASVLLVYVWLLGWIGYCHAPVYDEIAQLPAGIRHWQFATFDLYRLDGVLTRLAGSLPALAVGVETDWTGIQGDRYALSEFQAGHRFLRANGPRSLLLIRIARWSCIPFCLLGAWTCYCWASQLFGFNSGLIALVLWCSSPNLLGWGATLTPEVTAASIGVAAGYCYWRWLRSPRWGWAILAGVTFGLAQLASSTWLVLFVLWPLIWLITWWLQRERVSLRAADFARRSVQLLTTLLVGLYLLNAGYAFEGSFRPLGDFEFVSASCGGDPTQRLTGNRFRGTPLESIPAPLPANYLLGLDARRYDLELGKWSYLRGEFKKGGWWYYYAYACGVKTPLATLCLALLAAVGFCRSNKFRRSLCDELSVALPALAVFVLISSELAFNRCVRWILPALPYLFVSISRIGLVFAGQSLLRRSAVCLLLATTVVESWYVYPHSMSYFNLLAGGPGGGPAHLLDAAIDWGQDLLFLKKWLDRHPHARPFYLQYYGMLDPKMVGIEALPVPAPLPQNGESLEPGWYAVSINDLYGYRHPNDRRRTEFTYFQSLEPSARAGYSIYIYHISSAPDSASARP